MVFGFSSRNFMLRIKFNLYSILKRKRFRSFFIPGFGAKANYVLFTMEFVEKLLGQYKETEKKEKRKRRGRKNKSQILEILRYQKENKERAEMIEELIKEGLQRLEAMEEEYNKSIRARLEESGDPKKLRNMFEKKYALIKQIKKLVKEVDEHKYKMDERAINERVSIIESLLKELCKIPEKMRPSDEEALKRRAQHFVKSK